MAELTFLPMLTSGPSIPGQPSRNLKALFDLVVNDPGQRRKACQWNDKLANVARERAANMFSTGHFSHVDPDGHGPNWYARWNGYKLPDWYGRWDKDNNIESLGLNYQTPEEVWQGWLDSPHHRVHVLGELDFYADQTQVGIGFARGSEPYPVYWVFLSAPPEA